MVIPFTTQVGLGIDRQLELNFAKLAGAWMEPEWGGGLLCSISERLVSRPKSC